MTGDDSVAPGAWPELSGADPTPDESVRVVTLADGAALWTATTGEGPPVVCCHGGPGLWDYLGPLAALIEDRYTVIRFDQRGCGRSTGTGPFTIGQAIDDMDQLRAALGYDRWAVLGHSWGADLALLYAATHSGRSAALVYAAGVGPGAAYRAPFAAEHRRRLGADLARLEELSSGPRTDEEEHERCLLQWRADFSPTPPGAAARHARALWDTRPPDARVNELANRELWQERTARDLLADADRVACHVEMIFGADDPRPWTAAEPLRSRFRDGSLTVLDGAGHAPWVERPAQTRELILRGLEPARH